ncbi:MAG: hypothetical protein H6581_16295 [Bacteroidia bacterium]|nr:hypothetical protein [Bacteroidia bacterium]
MEVKDFREIDQKFSARAGMKWKVVNVQLTREDNPYDQLTREIVRPDRSVIFSSKDKISPLEERRIKTLLLRPGNEGLIKLYRESPYIQQYNLLIIIDQFENLFFTTKIKQREKADFIQLLLNASYHQGEIYVVTAFRPPRDERWRDKYRDLSEALIHCEFPLFHLKQKDLEKAISTFFEERSIQLEKKRNPNLLFVQPYTLKEEKHQELVQELFYEPEPFKVLEKTVTEDFIERYGIPPEKPFDSPFSGGDDADDDGIEFYFGEEKEAKSDITKKAERVYLNLSSTLKKRIAKKMFLYLASQGQGEDGLPKVKRLGEVIDGIGRYDVMVPEIVSIFGEEGVLRLNDAGPTDPKLEIQLPDPFMAEDWSRLKEWIEETGARVEISDSVDRERSISFTTADHAPNLKVGSAFSSTTISNPDAKKAEMVFEGLDSMLMKRAARKIFVELAKLPADQAAGLPGAIAKNELFNRVGRFQSILPATLSTFLEEGVLTPAPGDQVRIGHQVLFDAWPRMVKWLNENEIRPEVTKSSGGGSTAAKAPEAPSVKEKPEPKRPPRTNTRTNDQPEKVVAAATPVAEKAGKSNAPKSDSAREAETFYSNLKDATEKRVAKKILVLVAQNQNNGGITKDQIIAEVNNFEELLPRMILVVAASGIVEAKGGSVGSGSPMVYRDPKLPEDWGRLKKWIIDEQKS